MRNFEERVHEIHKRSHARIIRRRRQLTALCVPLVTGLCVGAALMIQPEINQPVDITQPTIPIIEQYSNSLPSYNVEFIPTYTDKEKVASIKKLIAELTLIEEFTIDATDADSVRTQATSAHEIYKFILESDDGTTEYTLIGNTLADRSADVVYKLSNYQRMLLCKLLGLSME